MVRLTIITIALAICVMEVSMSLVQGFEQAISDKVIGFVSDIQIREYNSDKEANPEVAPLEDKNGTIGNIQKMSFVKSVSPYIIKWAMVEKGENTEVFMLKGIDKNYDWTFFKNTLKEGKIPDFTGEEESLQVLISQAQAHILNAKVGDKITITFIQDPIKRRPVKVAGIYNTGLEEYDKITLFCDIRMLQNVMKWANNEVMGYEVDLHNSENLHEKADTLNTLSGAEWEAVPVPEIPAYAPIFDWLRLQNQNVWVILILMIAVAVINMTSVVLILIIERTQTIGVLNALGMKYTHLQQIFLWNMGMLMLPGMLIGNLLALGLLAGQYYFHWLTLDPENYFLDTVPVAWVWNQFVYINIGTFLICCIAMFLPTLIVSRITPMKAIRFQ
jgi:lipoprotein-releasing system permease protein